MYGIRSYTFAYLEDQAVHGGLSVYHIRSPFVGNMLLTCPFFGYGGFYADDDAVRDILLERLERLAKELKVDFIELRLRKRLPAPFEVNTDFLEFDLNLAGTPEAVWQKQLSSNTRQNIRKTRKNQLEFSISKSHRSCYELLCRTLRAHGTPWHGNAFFRLLRKHFADDYYFSEVRHLGKVVAAGVVIRFKQSIITPYIGSLEKHRSLRTNYCQYWGIINQSLEDQITRFELGRSPKGSSHVRFKKKWGSEEVPICYNYRVINPAKQYTTVSRAPRIYVMATSVWKRLPLFVTRLLGPRICRYIP